jgi:hypothetical protein
MEPEWLGERDGYPGTLERFIPGQSQEPAAVVRLDAPICVAGSEGSFLVLELRHVGTKWEEGATVHVELCSTEPEPKAWAQRIQGKWVESHAQVRRLAATGARPEHQSHRTPGSRPHESGTGRASMSHGEVFCSTQDPDGDLEAVFEDDGRVALRVPGHGGHDCRGRVGIQPGRCAGSPRMVRPEQGTVPQSARVRARSDHDRSCIQRGRRDVRVARASDRSCCDSPSSRSTCSRAESGSKTRASGARSGRGPARGAVGLNATRSQPLGIRWLLRGRGQPRPRAPVTAGVARSEAYVVIPPDHRETVRVRLVIDALAALFDEPQERFQGGASPVRPPVRSLLAENLRVSGAPAAGVAVGVQAAAGVAVVALQGGRRTGCAGRGGR